MLSLPIPKVTKQRNEQEDSMDKTRKDSTPIAEGKQSGALKINTPGGVFDCRWDETAQVTANGHLAAFSQFLECGGLFERLASGCPLAYTSHNAPSVRAVLATVVAGVLEGAFRYRHLDRLPSDRVSPGLFGAGRFMSCDSVRRAVGRMDAGEALEWIRENNIRSCADLLSKGYVLDLDPTVKTVYGHQEGAEAGYNPAKPGRPSHVYHTLCCAELRLVFCVALHPGKETAGAHSLPALDDFLGRLPAGLGPSFIRGDVGFGNETVMDDCESRGVRYLFKVRRSPGIRAVWKSGLAAGARWEDAGQGWEGRETSARLEGWSKERRLVVLRRRKTDAPGKAEAPAPPAQLLLPGIPEVLPPCGKAFEELYDWEVLATDLPHGVASVAQLYRDRGDCENIFDEMKNQWGWGGFTSHDFGRTAVMAALVMLVANWWNVFTRLDATGDGGHAEARGTRRALQRAVCRMTTHAGRRTLEFYTAGAAKPRSGLSSIMRIVSIIRTATQLAPDERWRLMLLYAFRKYDAVRRLLPVEIRGQLTLPFAT